MPREYGRKIGIGIAFPSPVPLDLIRRLLDWAIHCEEGHTIDGEPSACWQWQGHCDDDGYGQVKWRGKKYRASRIAYAAFVGPMDHGTDVDHQCRNRGCINPAHLEQVDPVENRVVRRNRRMKREECPI